MQERRKSNFRGTTLIAAKKAATQSPGIGGQHRRGLLKELPVPPHCSRVRPAKRPLLPRTGRQLSERRKSILAACPVHCVMTYSPCRYFIYTLTVVQSQSVKCTERAPGRKEKGAGGRSCRPPWFLGNAPAYWTQAIPRRKASMFRGMNLALGPANISWIMASMVSGLRILVPAT